MSTHDRLKNFRSQSKEATRSKTQMHDQFKQNAQDITHKHIVEKKQDKPSPTLKPRGF